MFKSNGNSQNDKLEIKARDNIKNTAYTYKIWVERLLTWRIFCKYFWETILKDNYFDSAKAPT